ncbi:MAG TPA: Gfo/Idh/MocA family oxidoreductase [Levilinea sp.]|nr:Gfo/Idh/MocA family oxidoreductase [Levilinea sp.]
MAKILKVGVVGVGGIARLHMPGWDQSPHAEVVVGCDTDPNMLENWGKQFSIKRLTGHYDELLRDPELDIIDVCTPSRYHMPLAVAALDAGKHVICEKPLAVSADEVRQMIEARDRSGKMLMTAHHLRFHGSTQALRAEISNGALGAIYYARAWWLRRAAFPGRPSFWMKRHSGGGACLDLGVHVLDLALWLMGNPRPVSVSGVSKSELAAIPGTFSIWGNSNVPEGADVEEFAAAFVRFENGASLSLEVSWLLHHDTPDDDRQVTLYGVKGGAHWPGCKIFQTSTTTRQLYTTQLEITRDNTPPHALECMEFARAIIEGIPSPVPAEQSLQVISILNAIYQSEISGHEICLDS